MPQEDRLTLKKMTFSKSLRGYSCDEVDTYIEYVTDKYAQVCREYTEVRRRLTTVAARESELRAEDEQALKNRMAKCQQSCDAMVDEAKRQAARILADAEQEAKLIIRHAEDEAQQIAAHAAKEGTRAQHEAKRAIAAKSNLADRLIQEIDSFRREVFAMYASHIDALEHLGKMTDDFYQQKTELTDAGELETPEMPIPAEEIFEEEEIIAEEPAEEVTEEEIFEEEPVEEVIGEVEIFEEVTSEEAAAEEVAEEEVFEATIEKEIAEEEIFEAAVAEEITEGETFEEVPVKIPAKEDTMDWESLLTGDDLPELESVLTDTSEDEDILFYEYAEPEESYETEEEEEEFEVWSGAEYDISEEEEEFEAWSGGEDGIFEEEPEETYTEPEEEPELTEEDLLDLLPEPENWEDTEESEEGEDDTAPIPDSDEEFTDTAELLRTLFGDADWEGLGETEDTLDDEDLTVEETDTSYEQDFGEDDHDLLLADLKSIYGAGDDDEEEDEDFREDNSAASFVPSSGKKVKTARDLDDLFLSGNATNSTKDLSLTGEFDLIYSQEKSMKNVEEIGKQPLVAPEAPTKPKKHSRF